MTDFKELFPGSANCTYLNTPAIGLLSQEVHDFKAQHTQALLDEGSRYFERHLDLTDQVREKIASFFNAEAGLTALLPAFTYGQNAVMEGLQPHSNILLLKDDYPSVNQAVESRNFNISYAPIDSQMEDHIYKTFKNKAPDAFVFSIVQYLNGIKIDLDFVKQLKKEFPDTLFIADGTQYLGQEQFDFKASNIDVLGASAYKWINAGFGNAFFLFKPGLEEKIDPKFLGFGSNMGKYKEAGDTLIGKFEGSHMDHSNMGSIAVGLDLQEKIGLDKIESRIRNLSQTAKLAFEELNLLEEAVVKRKHHSPIFNLKGDDKRFETLTQNNILCSQRGQGIRVGFHYYNSLEDLDRILEVLKA